MDLGGQVGAPALRGHGRGLHHALQDYHHLQLRVLLQRASVHLEEGRLIVDLVHNGDRGDQEDAVGAGVETHVDVRVVQREVLSFWGHPWLGGGGGAG